MGASDWMFGLILYFVGLFIIVSLFSIAGVFSNNSVVVNSQFTSSLGSLNTSKNADDLSFIPSKSYFKDIFSFFFWNLNVYDENNILTQYMWIIRLLLVWLPLLALGITIYYSLPTVSG